MLVNSTGLTCPSKAAAVSALLTIAGSFNKGIQKDSLLAVLKWVDENAPPDFTPETAARIEKIYNDCFDEAGQKAVTWEAHGGEPPDGTRIQVPFLFNAAKKEWELEGAMPPVWTEPNPDILPQQDIEGDDGAEF